jgi:hypothetical protein
MTVFKVVSACETRFCALYIHADQQAQGLLGNVRQAGIGCPTPVLCGAHNPIVMYQAP